MWLAFGDGFAAVLGFAVDLAFGAALLLLEEVAALAVVFGAGVAAADETAMVANDVMNKEARVDTRNFTLHSFLSMYRR